MQEVAEAHLGPRRKVEEVGAHNQGVVGEVEVPHLGEVVGAVGCKRGQGAEEGGEEGEDSHQVEVGEEAAEEEGELLHRLVRVVEVVLRARLDPLQSVR